MVEDSRTDLTGRLAHLAATIVLLGVLVAGGGHALFPMPLPDRNTLGGMHVTNAAYMHVASYANPEHEEADGTSPTRKR